MASSRILFPQFRDEQSSSKYPFADSATLTANDGLKIANDLFVDASFFGIGTAVKLYISQVVITPQSVTITVGDESNFDRLSTSYDILTPPDNGVLPFTDGYGRPAGILLAEPVIRDQAGNIKKASALLQFSAWTLGAHRFDMAATEIVATAVIPANEPGVRALATDNSPIQTGDIWLVGNNGVVIRAEGEDVIRIDIIGVPLFKRLVCAPQTDFPTRSFLKTINNCGPDEYGNFTITATNKNVAHPNVRIYPSNNTLVFDTIGP